MKQINGVTRRNNTEKYVQVFITRTGSTLLTNQSIILSRRERVVGTRSTVVRVQIILVNSTVLLFESS